jgi:hypothetical protein
MSKLLWSVGPRRRDKPGRDLGLTDQAKPLQIRPREKGNIPFFSRYGRYSMHETKAAANARESAEATCAKDSATVVRGRERESAVVVGGRRWRRRGSGQGEVAGESEVSVRGVKAVEVRAVGANSKSLVT